MASLTLSTVKVQSPGKGRGCDLPAPIAPSRERNTSLEKVTRSVQVPGLERAIEVKIASTREEWEEVFRLVAENYQARGYEAPSPYPYRFTPYHALPDSTTFVAKHAGRVVATLTLVLDNTLLGLPMESIYGEEINDLRRAGRHLVEVTSLADRDLSLREFVPVFVALMRLAAQYAVRQDADTWVITVNPRHRAFYRKVMGFAPLGPARAYPTVQNHPAEAYLLDLSLLQNNAPKMVEKIFGEWLPDPVLTPRRMPVELIEYFGSHSSQLDAQSMTRIVAHAHQFGSPRRW
jgi:hypothetical protein